MKLQNNVTTKEYKIQKTAKGPHEGFGSSRQPACFWFVRHKVTGIEMDYRRQIEAARVAVTRYMQRQGQIWIRIFPDKPITKKPAEVRMGKGKGNPEGFVSPVTPGRILIEVEGVSYEIAKEALRLAAQKLPVTTKFIVRRDYDPTQNV